MIGAIWPSFLRVDNGIPAGQGITTQGMVGYTIYWIVQLPLLCVRPEKVRWLFVVKSVVVPVAWIAILIWAFVAEGGGSMFQESPSSTTMSGSTYSWLFLANMTSILGNYATTSVNQSDFSRYSRVSARWQLLYVPMLPIVFTFISFIGIAASSAGQARYYGGTGDVPWDPTVLISNWSSRACRFFAAASFVLASLGVNISANSISAANDLAALAPRFFNIRRGQLLCAVLSWCLVPWKILESAESFLNFMSAYAIFLAPVAAIMLCDYWVVKQSKYDTLALYQPFNQTYRYSFARVIYGKEVSVWGVNWRAIAAFLAGVVPSLPGLIHSVNGSVEVGVGIHPYQFGWFLGFVGASGVYVGLSWWFPARETVVQRAVLADEIYEGRALTGLGIEEVETEAEAGRDEYKEVKV
ncbi:uncharacterized protein ACHE_21435S [Aspergillus chevalieri]|uniref:Uncharacterized protein n=1 Tax=Aspergillus chevalieri TaxID=182096 RepID=A0A7R7VJS9_ASPCH|nr:uncharacterized protein ACHE_21435S [Aspergillus chevalieri]BCR85977.1 hypothetical protein ACHE_21435S [Aspergillus chevalieri]